MDPSTPETRLRATLRAYADRAMTGGDVWPALARALREAAPAVGSARRAPALAWVLVPTLLLGGLLLVLWGGGWAQPERARYDGIAGRGAPRPAPAAPSPAVAKDLPGFGYTVWPTTTLPAHMPAPLIQTHNGYSVAIQPLAADANEVVISYTVSVAPGVGSPANGVLLATLQDSTAGTVLPVIRQGATLVDQAQQLVFDTGGRTDLPQNWGLHLTLTLETPPPALSLPSLPPPPPTGVIVGAPTFTPVPPLPAVVPPTPTAPPDPGYPTVGPPFQFAFTLPTDRRRRVADLHQSVTTNGVVVTLERVVVTNSQARAVLRPGVPGDARAAVDLLNVGWAWDLPEPSASRGPLTAGSPRLATDGSFIASQPGALLAQTGGWILTVGDATVMPGGSRTSATAVPGPWTFRFTVPALAPP